jgi:hypothetical protein
VRLIDILARIEGKSGQVKGRRLLDYGYGGIGHLRLLASSDWQVVGVDVDPLLHAFYRPSDQSAELKLVHGSWPGDAATRAAVGEGFDVIVSKNTLKHGYIRPSQQVDPRMLVDLGVTPAEFLAAGRARAEARRALRHLQHLPGAAPRELHPLGRWRVALHARGVRRGGLLRPGLRRGRHRGRARDGLRSGLGGAGHGPRERPVRVVQRSVRKPE